MANNSGDKELVRSANMRSIYDKKRRVSDTILNGLIHLSTGFALTIVLVILGYIAFRGVPELDFGYFINQTSILKNTVGILPNIINTLYMIVLTLLIAVPIGVGGAIYLNEYADGGRFVDLVSFTTEVLSGIPSIVYGLFGYLFFGIFMGLSYSILTGALTLAIMVLPLISRNTQVALDNVPNSYREAALGIGSTKWYMIRTVLLPSAIPGILTGIILAMGRVVAESAALIFTAGAVAKLPSSFFGHITTSGATLTIQLYFEMAKGNFDIAFVIAVVLMVIVLTLNFLARWISMRFDVNRIK